MTAPQLASRLSATGRLLVRSGTEIGRTLQDLRASGAPLTAQVADLLFLSRLLRVDEDAREFLVACSDSKPANAALLEERTVAFSCNHEGLHCEFAATHPALTENGGEVCIRLAFPPAVLVLQRRAEPRYAALPKVPLRCEIEWGPVRFDAEIVDVSMSGVGAMLYDPEIQLVPGTLLDKARISQPDRPPLVVALEVRYVREGRTRDGRPANRAGCRLIGDASEIESLIKLFVSELGESARTEGTSRS